MRDLSEIVEAMGLVSPVEVVCRDNGSWHVRWRHVEVKDGGILGGVPGDGGSYAEAVRDCWSAINALPRDQCLVFKAEYPEERRQFRWGGERWVDVPARRAA